MTIDPYIYGSENITGQYTGAVESGKLYVNKKYSGVIGGTFIDGRFKFYALHRFGAEDLVELEGLSGDNKVIVEKQVVKIKQNLKEAEI